MISLTTVLVVVLVMSTFGWRRRSWRRWEDPATARRLASLEAALAERDEQLLQMEGRVTELESRLDFTERLLASRTQDPETPRLP